MSEADPLTEPELLVDKSAGVLTVTFNRPRQRNAMTWGMYQGLYDACEQADSDDEIRVLVLRGAGGRAFVAGTDIAQFLEFQDGSDGVAYEERIARVVTRLEDVDVPTVAAIQGYCVGGGLAMAAVCDLRVATHGSTFGVPIARTLGNCLSMNTYSMLVHHLGPSRALDLLLRAKMISGDDAHAAGFVAEICADEEFDEAVAGVVETLLAHAPLSMWGAKEAIRRLRRSQVPAGDDIVSRVFGSDDFHNAVRAFVNKEKVVWTGR